MGNWVWMEVTRDRYELPVAVADSAAELAEITGKRKNTISSNISKQKQRNGKRPCQYVKVYIGDDS